MLLCYKYDNLESLNKCGKLNKLAVGICNENGDSYGFLKSNFISFKFILEVSCDDVAKYLVCISSSLEKENADENEVFGLEA